MTYFEYCAVNGVAVLLFILFYTLLKMFFIAYMYEHFSKKNKRKEKKDKGGIQFSGCNGIFN